MSDADRERLLAHFWGKVNKTETCWLWTAHVRPNGYGNFAFWLNGSIQNLYPHRVSYEIAKGPIQAGLVIDHLCRVRHCVNPAHLEQVTTRENVLRGLGIAATNAKKVVCDSGHPLTGENLYVQPRGDRVCRECARRSRRAWNAKRRARCA